MTLYECKYCSYSSSRYPDYKKHLGTKKHISNVSTYVSHTDASGCELTREDVKGRKRPIVVNKVSINDNNILPITCVYCNKLFKRSKNLNNHYKFSCKIIPSRIKNNYILSHNNNGNTKNKIELIQPLTGKIINNINNNTNNIVNNNLIVNPVGQESIEHIKKERLLEILSSGDNMLKEFCKEIYSVTENLNAYIDIRTKIITFINKDNKLEIETMSRMIQKIVYSHMDRIKSIMRVYREELPDNAVRLFDETINIYNCVINSDNIRDEKLIEEEHDRLNIRLLEDIKSSLMLVKDKCKRVIEDIKD
jgi:hypothetical protein